MDICWQLCQKRTSMTSLYHVLVISVLILDCAQGQFFSWQERDVVDTVINIALDSSVHVQPQYASCSAPGASDNTYLNTTQGRNFTCDVTCTDASRRHPTKQQMLTNDTDFDNSDIVLDLWTDDCVSPLSLGELLEEFAPCYIRTDGQASAGYRRETHVLRMKYDSTTIKNGILLSVQNSFSLRLTGNSLELYSDFVGYKRYNDIVRPNTWFHIGVQYGYYDLPLWSLFIDGVYITPDEVDEITLSRRKKRQSSRVSDSQVALGFQYFSDGELFEAFANADVLQISQCKAIGYSGLVEVRFRSNELLGDQQSIQDNILDRNSPTSVYNCPYTEEILTLFACSFYAPPLAYDPFPLRICREFCQEIVSACGSTLDNLPGLDLNCINDEYYITGPNFECVGSEYIPLFGVFTGEIKGYYSFPEILTNREIQALADRSAVLSDIPQRQCLCPPQAPAVSLANDDYCVTNADNDDVTPLSRASPRLRYKGTHLHLPVMAVDLDPESSWVSAHGIEHVAFDVVFPQRYQVMGVTFTLKGVPQVNSTLYPDERSMEIALLESGAWSKVHELDLTCESAGSGFPNDRYSYASEVPCQQFEIDYSYYPVEFSSQAYTVDFLKGKQQFYNSTYMDIELLSFLSGGGLRLQFNGFANGDSDRSHVINDLVIYAREYEGRVFCGCYAGGTFYHPDVACDSSGQCPCRVDIGDPALAGLKCEPYIKSIFPLYGPVAGVTKLLIEGGYFGEYQSITDAENHIHISFGTTGLACESLNATQTHMLCFTPPLNTSDPEMLEYLDQPLPINIQFSSGFHISSEEYTFTYRPDPEILDVQPLNSFLRGGITQTVSGIDFNSVAVPQMTLTVWSRGTFYPQEPTICTVYNNTLMYCPSPAINWDEINTGGGGRRRRGFYGDNDNEAYLDHEDDIMVDSVSGDRVKRQSPTSALNSDFLQFYVGFILDGVPTYRNVSESPLGPEKGTLTVFYDPAFREWDPEVLVFKPFDGDKFIDIAGDKLNFGAQMTDYDIKISEADCEVVELNTNKIICQPPKKSPKHDRFSKNDANRVLLTVGNIQYQIGYLQYYHTLWDDPAVRTAVIATVVVVGVIALGLLITWCVLKRLYGDPIGHIRRRFNYKEASQETNSYEERPRRLMDMLNAELKEKIVECLIEPHSRMKLGSEIGKGNFGKVYAGLLAMPGKSHPIDCAVKTLKEDSSNEKELREFLEEATIMKDFKHTNVLSLYGVVILQNKPHVLLPFMSYGDLRGYVNNPRNNFSVGELLDYGLQISKGMEYLSGVKFVHRDLAARNCMVDEKKVVKIADFGLARDIHEKDYYAVEDRRRPMPIKWMAPECLDTFKFDSRSDVWSYGVTLWEVMMRGRKPYAGIDNLDMKRYLQRGGRLDKPAFCPDMVYDLQLACWHFEPEERPTFSEIVVRLNGILEEARAGENPPEQQQDVTAGQHDYLEMVRMSQAQPGYVPLETHVPADDDDGQRQSGAAAAADNNNMMQSKPPSERYTREPHAANKEYTPQYLKPFTELPADQRVKDEVEGYAGVRRPSQDKTRYQTLSQEISVSPDGDMPPTELAPSVPSPDDAYLAPTSAAGNTSPDSDGYLPPSQQTTVDMDGSVNYTNL